MMKLRSELITNLDLLKPLAQQWSLLLDRSEGDSLFMTPEWILTWVEMEQPDLFVVAIFEEQTLVGLAPFYLSDLVVFKILKRPCLRLLGDKNSSSEYLDILVDRSIAIRVLSEIGVCLQDHRRQFDFMWFPYCSMQRGALDRFRHLIEALEFDWEKRDIAFYVATLPATWQEFESGLSAKQRNNIRRYEKKLKQIYPDIELVNDVSSVGVDAAFETLRSVHRLRWQEKGEVGAFSRNRKFNGFIASLSSLLARQDRVFSLSLKSDGKVLATRWGFVYKRQFYEIQTGFDPALNGAGIVNIYLAIRFAIDAQLIRYDFLSGSSDYKARFSEPESGAKLFSGKKSELSGLIVKLGIWPTGRFITI